MKKVMVWFCGLNTSLDSDWCGIRGMLESLADELGASLVAATWDGAGMSFPVEEMFYRLPKFDWGWVGGHSHGAWRAYDRMMDRVPNVQFDEAAWLDLAPPGKPTAWMGPAWIMPDTTKHGLCFYQRLDVPLAGVKMEAYPPSKLDIFNTTHWGLGHNGMVKDQRVHDRIALSIRASINFKLHREFLQRLS